MPSPSRLLLLLLATAVCQNLNAQPPDFGRREGDRGGFGRDRSRDRSDDRGREGGFSRGGFEGGPPGSFGSGPPMGFGGPPDPGRFFGFIDRNQDGVIDAEEYNRLPPPVA